MRNHFSAVFANKKKITTRPLARSTQCSRFFSKTIKKGTSHSDVNRERSFITSSLTIRQSLLNHIKHPFLPPPHKFFKQCSRYSMAKRYKTMNPMIKTCKSLHFSLRISSQYYTGICWRGVRLPIKVTLKIL